MNVTIAVYYPNCQSKKIKKNGNKISRKQNYQRINAVDSNLLATMSYKRKNVVRLWFEKHC